MKRRKIVLLFLIYLVIFVFTVSMEWVSIRSPQMRMLVNCSTLLMAGVGGGLFWLVYRSGKQQEEQNGKAPEEKEGTISPAEGRDDCFFDKEKYLAYAKQKDLTRRETEIGLLVANGYTNLQIAENLYIAETTVKKHLSHIYEKTGVAGRKEWKEVLRRISL